MLNVYQIPFFFTVFILLVTRLAAEFLCATPDLGTTIAAKPIAQLEGFLESRGHIKALTVFAKFSDQAPTSNSPPAYADNLFKVEYPGSLAHFYDIMSFGQLNLRGEVLARRYASDYPTTAYLAKNSTVHGDYGNFVLEIMRQVDRDVNLSDFDNDGPDGVADSGDDDGIVDYVFVNTLSIPKGFLIGAATGIVGLGFNEYLSEDLGYNGQPIRILGGVNRGAIQQEGTWSQTVGSMAHEFGHSMGLPDLYDTSFLEEENQPPAADGAGIGRWGLMGWGAHGWYGDDGPEPLTAWSLEQLGWIGSENNQLIVLEEDANAVGLNDLVRGGVIFKVYLHATQLSNSTIGQDYLLLEYRSTKGHYYNQDLPAAGLLIWHIRPYMSSNADETRKLVELVSADRLKNGDNLNHWAHDASYTKEHFGNLGDATDLYDGINFSLYESSSPSSAASTVRVRTKRIGEEDLAVDIEIPHWQGIINEEIHWAGSVLVHGDLRIAPEGRLVIHPNTRVRLAATDGRATGFDKNRIEILVQGDLNIEENSHSFIYVRGEIFQRIAQPVRFEPVMPTATWYGIVFDPQDNGQIQANQESYQLFGAEKGISILNAPIGVQDVVIEGYTVLDSNGKNTAGNGDGYLRPGETFQVAVEMANWSLKAYENMRLQVAVLKGELSSINDRRMVETRLHLYPGNEVSVDLPAFTLDPAVVAGTEVEFSVVLKATGIVHRDTLRFLVGGRYPQGEVELEIPDATLFEDTAFLKADSSTVIRASIEGEFTGADLIVRSLPDLAWLGAYPMHPMAGTSHQYFTYFYPETGYYQLSLRLYDAVGGVSSRLKRRVVSLVDPEHYNTLVFMGEPFNPYNRQSFQDEFAQVLTDLEMAANFVFIGDIPSNTTAVYDALLRSYLETGRQVIWLGRSINKTQKLALTNFLDGGGHLIIASRDLHKGSSIKPFLQKYVHVREVKESIAVHPDDNLGQIANLGLPTDSLGGGDIRAQRLELVAPAVPLLLGEGNSAVSSFVANDDYRLVYMPIDIMRLNRNVRRLLLDLMLRRLNEKITTKPTFEIDGSSTGDLISFLKTQQNYVLRAQTSEMVEHAEVILYRLDVPEALQSMPMKGTLGEFSVQLRLAETGDYLSVLRLHFAAGHWVDVTSLQLIVGPDPTHYPILALLGDYMLEREKSDMRATLDKITKARNLPLAIIDMSRFVHLSADIYKAFLEPYGASGGTVFWFGRTLDEASQVVFKRFLKAGGRLFATSPRLNQSPQVESFLRQVLRLENVSWQQYGQLSSVEVAELTPFTIQYIDFDVLSPAQILLATDAGRAAGLQLDNGGQRLVYLPFDLENIAAQKRDILIGNGLDFLHQLAFSPAQLKVEKLLGLDDVVPLAMIAPKVVIANRGGQISSTFELLYRIVQHGKIVESRVVPQEALGAGVQREVVLPAWEPTEEGLWQVQIAIKLGTSTDSDITLLHDFKTTDSKGRLVSRTLPDDPVAANGAGFFDYDNDGDLDLYLVCLNSVNKLYQNNGGQFIELAAAKGIADAGQGRGLALGDYDSDGDLDLYLVNQEANALYQNHNGMYRQVSAADGSLNDKGSGRSASFFDYDNDGDLDLYIVNAHGNNQFFLNENGTLVQFTEAVNLVDQRDGRGLVIGDVDSDGDSDLLVANRTGGSWLYTNNWAEKGGFTSSLIASNEGAVAVVLGDYDSDSDLDLYISNELHENKLYRNDQGVFVAQVQLDLGKKTAGAGFWDYDNDGDLDIVATAVSRLTGGDFLYQNRGTDGFVGVGVAAGMRQASSGRGLTFGDYDEDGRQDLLVADAKESRLYHNTIQAGHWLSIALRGLDVNYYAIGTNVEIYAGKMHQWRELQSGFGYGSQAPPILFFGLGNAMMVDSLRVHWPDGRESMFTDLVIDQHVELLAPQSTAVIMTDSQPHTLQLYANYPNPFNAGTLIHFTLPQTADVRIEIFNINGQLVRQLRMENVASGYHQVFWDGMDAMGQMVASGVYLCRLKGAEQTALGRLTVLK